jgi:diguanylate cyclase (GGDEF)-like protein
MGLDPITLLLGIVAIAVVLALALYLRGRPREEARTPAPETSALTTFTYELFAAQTTADTKTVVGRHLPVLLGTSRVWVSSFAGGRRQLIVAHADDDASSQLLLTDFQEWTTLPLRAGNQVVGLMGVDSAAARGEHARHAMHQVAPLIGQALQNAYTVDTLREASLMDSLTGTATRREGLARLHAEVKRAQRTGASMAVLLLDLDRFKSINDRCGHAMGDAVLTAVGQTLTRTLRASDIRCRWGGEEFLVVLPDTDLTRAQVVAQGLLKNIAAATVPTPQGPVSTTASIGLTMTQRGEMNLEAIIQRADVALYRAKNAGRARVSVEITEHTAGEEAAREQQGTKEKAFTPAEDAAADAVEKTLPFPDRRSPNRPDRRLVPGGGRRVGD